MSTTEYRVIWIIEVEADSPMEAAEKAMEIQRDPESTATSFAVSTLDGRCRWLIDLDEGTVEYGSTNEERLS